MGSIKAFDKSPIDLTIVGKVKYRDGIGRIAIGLAQIVKDQLWVNYIPCGKIDFNDLPDEIIPIVMDADETPGNVGFLTSPIQQYSSHYFQSLPKSCFIKIAYSLIESTKVPSYWVTVLNEEFDAVVVADKYFRSVYEDSGVTIPIYVLPHGIYLEHLLDEPLKKSPSKPFIFGSSAAFESRKNQQLLVKAFLEEFKNEPDVLLTLQGRYRNKHYFKSLIDEIEASKAQNIKVVVESLPEKAYVEFLNSLDCYVLLSKGEGFSITPREALALGKPCILSDNTAHRTICSSGFVYAVPSTSEIPATYAKKLFMDDQVGNQYDCSVEEVRKALRRVYQDYQKYVALALQGRKWVEMYTWNNLKHRFMNLIKPTRIVFGDENHLTDSYLMTNSRELYDKYTALIQADVDVS